MLRAALPFLASALLCAAAVPAAAQTAPAPTIAEAQPRISVTGEGEKALRPDIALLTFSVMREAPSAREALTANNEAMAEVIAALKEDGIADRDLQTAGIQINPRYDYPNDGKGGQRAELAAYQVTNTLSVRVRDIARTGAILDKVVSLGVNQGGGISFTNADPSAALAEARRAAVADAMEKARTLAQAAGVELGRILEISERADAPEPVLYMQAKMASDRAESVPVEAGENSYRVSVTMSFGIDQ